MKLVSILTNPKQLVLRGILFFISCAFSGSLAWTQATPDISIDTRVSGDVVVCTNQVTFTVYIQNTSSADLSGLILYPKMPSGMVYVAGSASGMTEITPINTDNPSFYVPALVAGSVPFSVTFKAQADCRLISYIKNRTGGSPTLVNNNTTITYSKGGASLEILEPNGSDSYNVLYPVFEVSFNPGFPNDDDLKPVHYMDKENRHF